MECSSINNANLNISISGIFSNSNFKNVINKEESSYIDKKIRKYRSRLRLTKECTREDALTSFYDYLLNNYRCEYVYKNLITENILLGRHSLNTTTQINEFKIGSSQADTVLINGKSCVYEIKTELDSPDRLASQLLDYQKAFSLVYLVVHHTEVDKYTDILSNSSVGLIALNERLQLSERKKVVENSAYLDIETMFKCLRKKEYTTIIAEAFGHVPNVPNMFYFRECLNLAKKMRTLDFQKSMNRELKKRKPQEREFLNSNKVPKYLSNICLSIDPTSEEYIRLLKYLTTKI